MRKVIRSLLNHELALEVNYSEGIIYCLKQNIKKIISNLLCYSIRMNSEN